MATQESDKTIEADNNIDKNTDDQSQQLLAKPKAECKFAGK
jgi:hypothetical protein